MRWLGEGSDGRWCLSDFGMVFGGWPLHGGSQDQTQGIMLLCLQLQLSVSLELFNDAEPDFQTHVNREFNFLKLKWKKKPLGLFFFDLQNKFYCNPGCWMEMLPWLFFWSKSLSVVGEQWRICQMQIFLNNYVLLLYFWDCSKETRRKSTCRPLSSFIHVIEFLPPVFTERWKTQCS